MAGVGEAASIAGLVSLSGQALDGVAKLYNFATAYRHVSSHAEETAKESTDLRQILSQVQNIGSRALVVVPELQASIDALHGAISQCQTKLSEIEHRIEVLQPGHKRAKWKRLKAAAVESYFVGISTQLSSERENLSLRLDTFNCELDLLTKQDIKRVVESTSMQKFNHIETMQALGLHAGTTEAQLQALDTKLCTLQQKLELSLRQRRLYRRTMQSRKIQTKNSRRVSSKAKRLELTGLQRNPPGVTNHTVRIVTPAILQYERKGKTEIKAALHEVDYSSEMDNTELIKMIQYLQNLRIVLWLLRRDHYVTTNNNRTLSLARSSLLVQAALTFSWEVSTFGSTLPQPQTGGAASREITKTPWIRYVTYADYVLRCAGDGCRQVDLSTNLRMAATLLFPGDFDIPMIEVLMRFLADGVMAEARAFLTCIAGRAQSAR